MKTYLLFPTETQEKTVISFLEENNISFFEEDDDDQKELPQHVIDGIKRGQEDIEAGRTISMEEFKKGLNLSSDDLTLDFHPKPIIQLRINIKPISILCNKIFSG